MGKQRIVISERDNIATLFEDDAAVEFIIHRGDVLLGDVYLAQVENILPSIDAAFVNVGMDKMGFLHSSDVQGRGELKNRLQPKQNLVVQVMKEPTGHKGPRVTTNIAMPGRFLVLMPESRGISISRKIVDNKERARLKSVLSLTKPPGVGVIIRTEAEGQTDAEIQEDFETLLERWQHIVAMADTAKPPTLLYRDQDLLYRVIREMVTENVKEIIVDSAFGQHRANQILQNWGIEHSIKVTLYAGAQSIMVGCGVDREIKNALQTKVPLPSGGYLYIQPTEALTVVDVNSGKFTSLQSQSETIRLTNLEAAKEIARQLRLRNIGGMMIVDFIDMESRANQLSVLSSFEMELGNDKAKPQIGQLSDLGLVEMTRHRQGQSLNEIFTKKCLSCSGGGTILEEFNWAPPSGEGGRTVMGRSRLPIRGGQQRPGPQPQQQQTGQQRAVPRANQQSLRKFIDPRGDGPQMREGFLQQSKDLTKKQEKQATETMSLLELYQFKLSKATGARLASIVKVSKLPFEINNTLIRMNPKANDIFTLVDVIEGAGFYMNPDSYGDNNGEGEEGSDEGSDDASDEERLSQNEAPESVEEVEEVAAELAEQSKRQIAQDDLSDDEDDGPVMPDFLADDVSEDADELPDTNDRSASERPLRGRGRAVAPRETQLAFEDLSDVDLDEDDDDEGETAVKVAAPKRRGRPPKRVMQSTNDD
jgi:ribonuclease E